MYFKPSASQQQDLDTLLAEQQDPTSANYHKWITPAEWATRFGMSDADLQKVQAWLTSQGFTIDGVSNSRNSSSFSGTAAQAEAAFGTEIHTYTVNGSSYFAPSSELSIPSALSGVVLGVRNLNSFRPTPHRILKSNFTSSTSGNHYLAPDDITTIYDVKALYNAGYDGTGERIAVVGQSAISTTDVANFRSAAGLASKAPTLVLVPGTGSSVTSSGDETESDLDVEWSGAIAKNADVYFVYTGSNSNYSVFDALDYVVQTNLAPVISVSYGTCEANLSTSDKTTLLSWFQQANSQGQTIIAAAGDSGAADCDYQATSASKGLAVDVPAAYAEVTGIGGTTFSEGSGSYWNSSNNSYNGSALSYIPEVVWNDTSSAGELAAGGGGKSILFTKPSWQSATGVPSDGARDVPDISLDASNYHDGYLYCSEDSSTGITGSCSNGFRDANNTYLTVAGGTSFGAPIFSGILTMSNQWKAQTGQGNINAPLYYL
jgi:subtilase family serine protease